MSGMSSLWVGLVASLVICAACGPARMQIDLDQDGDGLLSEQERTLGTDPNRADTDGDGFRDGDELAHDPPTDPLDGSDHPFVGRWGVDRCPNQPARTGNTVGEIAHDFGLQDQDDVEARLEHFCGRLVLLVSAAFW